MQQKILFFPTHTSSIRELLPVARRLIDDARFTPVFLITRKGKIDNKELDRLSNLGIEIRDLTQESSHEKYFRVKWPEFVRVVLDYYRDFRGKEDIAREYLTREDVAALALVGDRTPGWETLFIKAANDLGIKSIILPFAYSHPIGTYLQRKSSKHFGEVYEVRGLLKKALAVFMPGHVFSINSEKILFYPAEVMIAGRLLRVLPKKPWILGGGCTTKVAVESDYMRDVLFEYGVEKQKVEVTGKPRLDQDVSASYAPMSENHGKIRIVISIPAWPEVGKMDWGNHTANLRLVLSSLRSIPNSRIIASLHPRSDANNYRALLSDYEAELSERSIYELIRQCDLFVAGPSSTILIALALGKTAISLNYGVNRMTAMPITEKLEMVYDTDELGILIYKLQHKLRHAPQRNVTDQYWSILDGKNTQRTVDTLYEMVG